MRPLTTLDRRALLKALSLAPAHAVRVPPAVEAEVREAGLISSQVCLLSALPETAAQSPALLRADLAEGTAGLPMELRLQVVTDDGAPMAGTRVDISHRAAARDLSGRQVADAMGRVQFRTIVPEAGSGGRALINVRLHLMTGEVAETTLVFDAMFSREIHASHDVFAASADVSAALSSATLTPIARRMTAPDGKMDVALVMGVTRQGSRSGQIDRLRRLA